MNANPKHVSNLVSKLPELNVAASAVEAAIPRSGYRFETATSSKAAIEKYLGVLMHYDAKSIGGKLPGADFYVDVLSDY